MTLRLFPSGSLDAMALFTLVGVHAAFNNRTAVRDCRCKGRPENETRDGEMIYRLSLTRTMPWLQ